MIQQLIDRFMANKDSVRAAFAAGHPNDYADVVKIAVEAVTEDDYGENPLDPQRIHEIDDGNVHIAELQKENSLLKQKLTAQTKQNHRDASPAPWWMGHAGYVCTNPGLPNAYREGDTS